LGVSESGGVEEKERRGVLAGRQPRAPPLPRVQLETTRGKILAKISKATERERQCRSPLARFFLKERKKREG
jgi:hypothetical protein